MDCRRALGRRRMTHLLPCKEIPCGRSDMPSLIIGKSAFRTSIWIWEEGSYPPPKCASRTRVIDINKRWWRLGSPAACLFKALMRV